MRGECVRFGEGGFMYVYDMCEPATAEGKLFTIIKSNTCLYCVYYAV